MNRRKTKFAQWTELEFEELVGKEKTPPTYEIVRRISCAELMRFKVGLDGLNYRSLTQGDSALGIISEQERSLLLSPQGFLRLQLEAAHAAGAGIVVIYFGSENSFRAIREFIK